MSDHRFSEVFQDCEREREIDRKFATSMPVRTEIVAPTHRCPKCRHESGSSIGDTCSLVISIPPYEGQYCLKCIAALIAANIPKLENIDEKDKNPTR